MSRWAGLNAVLTNGARMRRREERTPSVTFGDSSLGEGALKRVRRGPLSRLECGSNKWRTVA